MTLFTAHCRRLTSHSTPLGLSSIVSGTPTLGLYQPRALCAVAPPLLPGLRGGERMFGGDFGLLPGPGMSGSPRVVRRKGLRELYELAGVY
eukprot:scaffold8833_cov58-Phaeocystis_antarctica.AAC.5